MPSPRSRSRAGCRSRGASSSCSKARGSANDATALILYRFAVAAVSAGVFSLGEAAGTFAAIVVGEILWGIGVGWLMLRLRRWVDDPPDRDHALDPDAVPRLLAARASRRLGRSRHRDGRALHQLERSPADQRRDAPAGHLLLGFPHLPHRGHGVPHHRPAGAHADAPHRPLSDFASSRSPPPSSAPWSSSRASSGCFPPSICRAGSSASIRRRDPSPPWQWPFVLAVHRRARHRLARRGARDPVRDGRRGAVSGPRPHPVSDLLRDPRDPGGAGPDASLR